MHAIGVRRGSSAQTLQDCIQCALRSPVALNVRSLQNRFGHAVFIQLDLDANAGQVIQKCVDRRVVVDSLATQSGLCNVVDGRACLLVGIGQEINASLHGVAKNVGRPVHGPELLALFAHLEDV